MPASKDPKSYVRPVPLPVPSCKGVKLLARDKLNFNLESPSREEVFISNYFRRQNQLSNMGFRSASHKPYMGIGDPFYLDEKKMILHALGQWTEEHASSSSSSDESDEEEEKKDTAPKPAFTAAKFVLRRSRKDLNTLNKAVVHGRNMIRNVSLGHGLFDLIDKEKQHKKEASEEAIRKRREQLRNEFQPPKTESDDDTDDDMNSDVDLANYMVPVAPPTFLTQQQMDTDEELGIVNDNGSESDQSPEREPEIITFSGMALAEHEEEYQRARSAMVTSEMTSYSRPVSRRKKKQETPRPYTPQHTNLSANISMRESVADSEPDLDITRDALFRQLCVLHWILEAMSTDPPSPMTPIMSCWSLTDIGGSRAQPKKLMRDKATESGWVNFLSKDNTKVSKRLSTTQRLLMNRRRPVMHTAGRNSAQSSATGSVQGSNTGLNTLTNQMSMLGARNREDDLSPRPEDEEDQMYNKSIFKFLDEYYESLKTEEEAKKKNELDNKSPSSTPPTTPVPEKKVKDKSPKRKKKKDGNEKRLDHKVAVALGEEEKMTSRYLRANAHMIRPKSSPALQDFQAGLPSSKKISLCADLHNQFAECREEKALTLHDILDHKESQRLLVCKSKFVSLQGMKRHGSSFHRAVEQMRTQSWQQLRKPVNDRKKSVAKGNWYTDLLEKIPLELKQEWFYSKILQKLGNFGLPFRHRKGSSFEKALVEGTGKQSIYKFIKVLEGLREWEICCPDITAAVEFCRERIVEMTVDEYESWFTQRFPKVTRPQTAPPATKSEKKDTRLGSGLSSARKVVVKRPTQSAFTRRVQH
ncbi:coiled-coil domain-containing protein 60-like isoform X8 [Ruditapes philippinarum]|uniref:coiled-coil domain-containing protein 60-like isoform X8 n=1 Tax=Ruditapes philippinarum TaxID=129788 RepID=UPI00295AA977|nr:coiled-coil domain-containing protein 60-like isoform X8 [Ruditapes philippinarum]